MEVSPGTEPPPQGGLLFTKLKDSRSLCAYRGQKGKVGEGSVESNIQFVSFTWLPLHENKKSRQISISASTVVVQSLRHVQLSATHGLQHQSSIISLSLLKLMSIESAMPSNYLILRHPFLPVQSFPASGSFPVSQLCISDSQSIGASASAAVRDHRRPAGPLAGLVAG